MRKLLVSAVLLAGCAGDSSRENPGPDVHTSSPTAEATPSAEPVDVTATTPADPVAHPNEVYPLKDWMSANLARAVKTQDFAALERALGNLGSMGPAEFTDWYLFAKAGATAARAKEIDQVRASCADCHQKYRADYRARMRTRPLPEMRSAR